MADAAAVARAILGELASHAAPANQGRQLRGSSTVLVSSGVAGTPPSDLQTRALVEVTGPARSYIIGMRGVVQSPSVVPAQMYAAARFRVIWGIAGLAYTTTVDGFSDQFLTVYGEQVSVFAEWDEENIARMFSPTFPVPAALPSAMLLSAGISPSEGGVTQAKRTFLLRPSIAGAVDAVPVPYAARGVSVRSNIPGEYAGGIAWVQQSGASQVIDSYTGAEVLASHGRGEYLSVPSMTDVALWGLVPPLTTIGAAEFLLQP